MCAEIYKLTKNFDIIKCQIEHIYYMYMYDIDITHYYNYDYLEKLLHEKFFVKHKINSNVMIWLIEKMKHIIVENEPKYDMYRLLLGVIKYHDFTTFESLMKLFMEWEFPFSGCMNITDQSSQIKNINISINISKYGNKILKLFWKLIHSNTLVISQEYLFIYTMTNMILIGASYRNECHLFRQTVEFFIEYSRLLSSDRKAILKTLPLKWCLIPNLTNSHDITLLYNYIMQLIGNTQDNISYELDEIAYREYRDTLFIHTFHGLMFEKNNLRYKRGDISLVKHLIDKKIMNVNEVLINCIKYGLLEMFDYSIDTYDCYELIDYSVITKSLIETFDVNIIKHVYNKIYLKRGKENCFLKVEVFNAFCSDVPVGTDFSYDVIQWFLVKSLEYGNINGILFPNGTLNHCIPLLLKYGNIRTVLLIERVCKTLQKQGKVNVIEIQTKQGYYTRTTTIKPPSRHICKHLEKLSNDIHNINFDNVDGRAYCACVKYLLITNPVTITPNLLIKLFNKTFDLIAVDYNIFYEIICEYFIEHSIPLNLIFNVENLNKLTSTITFCSVISQKIMDRITWFCKKVFEYSVFDLYENLMFLQNLVENEMDTSKLASELYNLDQRISEFVYYKLDGEVIVRDIFDRLVELKNKELILQCTKLLDTLSTDISCSICDEVNGVFYVNCIDEIFHPFCLNCINQLRIRNNFKCALCTNQSCLFD